MHGTQNFRAALALAIATAGCGRLGFEVGGADAGPALDAPDASCGPDDAACFAHAGRAYAVLTRPRTANDASAACAAMGMRLARIDDAAEDAALWARAAPSVVWLDADDEAVEGEWRWRDDGAAFFRAGAPVDGVYSHWGPGEPNNTGGNEDCLTMWPPHGGAWADERCELTYGALCEAP